MFDVPPGLNEFGGEIVEQFRMGRPFALGAEIFNALGDAGAEIESPETIDQDARGKGIVGGGDPVGEIEASETRLSSWLSSTEC